MTKAEQKLEVAKANRVAIIAMIESILIDERSYMTVKEAMNVFLSANTKDCSDAQMVMVNGYQKVRKECQKFVKKVSLMSEAMKLQRPSSMR